MSEVKEDDLLEMCEESFDIEEMNVSDEDISGYVLFSGVPDDEIDNVVEFWKELDNGV